MPDRIREAAKRVGSGDALSQKAGIPRSTLETYLTGEAEPKASRLAAIAHAAQMSAHYLVTGEGPSEPGMPGLSARRPLELRDPGISARDELVYVPLYDIRATGGKTGKLVGDEYAAEVLAFKKDWIRRELRASPEQLRLLYVEGNSMEPDLRAGDIILIDHTDNLARHEGVYVIRLDDALLVKQLQHLPGGLIKVISRNPAYESFTVAASKIQEHNGFAVVGRVVWACRRY